ncbi:MAG: hypothetical protein Q4D89_14815 [Arachnia propionica]|uniref:hypothetical protein n=1 Tax=Arachnia propionica TaxID=1750 RepID=UPI0027063AB1|nr:hypothetical protein [Arachnia propionica]
MTFHRVKADACYEIFTKVEAKVQNAGRIHNSVSGDVDALGALCTGESSILASKLNGLYNRVLTESMTSAEQQITNAAAGGRASVAAIQAGHHEMADQTAKDAHAVDEVRITDGKPA